MKKKISQFKESYGRSLTEYISGAGEIALQDGYELGRRALHDGLGVMDILSVHKSEILKLSKSDRLLPDSMNALVMSCDLLSECLAPFELTHRGFLDVEFLNNELEEVNKELESFSYSVSHDLRMPLRAIDGYTRMIQTKSADKFDEEEQRRFQVIRDHVQIMYTFIDDLLKLSRLGRQTMMMSTVNMDSLFHEVWEELTTLNCDRQLMIIMDPIDPANGDRDLLQHVVFNLLSNAIKFTRDREKSAIKVGGYIQGHEIVYYVEDNGAGFNMAYYDKLFTVFQRLHTSTEFEGTGVGLAVVQRIIRRHGGRVWAKGEEDKGATFFFSLPSKDNVKSTKNNLLQSE